MRVLLINPWESEIFPPPSIGYLQATLRQEGVDVRAVDLDNAFQEDEYDLVAVSFHSFSVKHARRIRDHYKGRLICGGHHPSALPDQMLAIGYDQVVIGEGEIAISEIINGNSSPVVTGKSTDINSIPFPDYTGLKYSGEWGLPVISSRGCPFDCSFCGSVHFWGRRYRTRTAENVLQELEVRVREGVRAWMFEDDNFTVNKKRVKEICDGIIQMGSFKWQCTSRAEVLDKELCQTLKRAGCETLWLGVESLSQDSLNRCRKMTTVDKMLAGIKEARAAGLSLQCLFIAGIPGDTIEDIQTTVKTIKSNGIEGCGANILWILPKTDAYYKAKSRGFSDEIFLQSGAPFYTLEQDWQTLKTWANLIKCAV